MVLVPNDNSLLSFIRPRHQEFVKCKDAFYWLLIYWKYEENFYFAMVFATMSFFLYFFYFINDFLVCTNTH